MIKVCHMTSVHQPFDTRIFLKECMSLSQEGYDTYLVVKGNSCEKNGVHVVGCGESKGRFRRMLFFAGKIYREAIKLDCDIYHFHDPELLGYGLRLKKRGKKVIFDSHEDVPAQILDKEWIPMLLRKMISGCYRLYETYVVKRIDAVVAATPHIGRQFEGRARKITVVNNYPRLDDIVFHTNSFEEREAIVCYAGGISEIRGEKVMIEAMRDLDGILVLAGEHEKMQLGGVKYLGQIDRNGINRLYGQAVAGLSLLLPAKNYINSLPIKMFEYMAAGLPFVASDFSLWSEIVNRHGCGFCIPVDDRERIEKAILFLLTNRKEAERMGKRGRKAVEDEYNWGIESIKLFRLYRDILSELQCQ